MPTFLLLTHFEIVIVVRLRGWSGWMRCSDLEVAFAFHQFTLGRCGGFWPWASDTRRAERTRLGVLSPTRDFSLNHLNIHALKFDLGRYYLLYYYNCCERLHQLRVWQVHNESISRSLFLEDHQGLEANNRVTYV